LYSRNRNNIILLAEAAKNIDSVRKKHDRTCENDEPAMPRRYAIFLSPLLFIGMAIPHPTTRVNLMPNSAKNALPLLMQQIL
jgi:hypothetical protein